MLSLTDQATAGSRAAFIITPNAKSPRELFSRAFLNNAGDFLLSIPARRDYLRSSRLPGSQFVRYGLTRRISGIGLSRARRSQSRG